MEYGRGERNAAEVTAVTVCVLCMFMRVHMSASHEPDVRRLCNVLLYQYFIL